MLYDPRDLLNRGAHQVLNVDRIRVRVQAILYFKLPLKIVGRYQGVAEDLVVLARIQPLQNGLLLRRDVPAILRQLLLHLPREVFALVEETCRSLVLEVLILDLLVDDHVPSMLREKLLLQPIAQLAFLHVFSVLLVVFVLAA